MFTQQASDVAQRGCDKLRVITLIWALGRVLFGLCYEQIPSRGRVFACLSFVDLIDHLLDYRGSGL